MNFDLPSALPLAMLLAALLAGGALTGVLSGLLGVGGGGILVPILYDLFHVLGVPADARMHMAVGTSLAIIIPTSLSAVYAHYKRKAVDGEVIKRLWAWVLLGVLVGIFVAAYAPGNALKAVFAASALFMASKLFFGWQPLRTKTQALPGNPLNGLVGAFTGLISTLIGIGGGVYISSYMTLFGRTMHQAVATASAVGPVIAIPAAIGYAAAGWGQSGLPPLSLGYVSLLAMAVVAPASVLFAPLGVRIAHGISRRKLELGFATFLVLVAARFIYSLIES